MFPTTTLLSLVALATLATAQGTPAFTGELLIQPGNSAAKCLKADNTNGAPVVLQTCTGNADQRWTFVGNGQVRIHGNKCLDVVDGKNVDGAKLQVWDCDGANANPNQKWWYTAYGDNHIAWTDHGKCIDLTDSGLWDGNQMQVWSCSGTNPNHVWNVGFAVNQLPAKSADGQFGTNQCGTGSSQTSNCQTAWINDADDFCLWAPPNPNSNIGDTEREEVAWCTRSGRGTRTIPNGALKGVHFVRTPDYVQVTGQGDFTLLNVRKGDSGGELDPHGADSRGNPVGGLVYGNTFGANLQYHEWTSFMSDSEFCFRACTGPNARENCQHIYDVMGCYWNMPANYNAGTFESCKADNDLPMGVYGTSTWYQGVEPTPAAHPAASSSECKTFPTITVAPVKRSHGEKKRRASPSEPAQITQAPKAREL